MMLNKNMKVMIHSPDGDTDFDICCWSLARKYIRAICVYYLSRIYTTNVNISNKRKWFHSKKKDQK